MRAVLQRRPSPELSSETKQKFIQLLFGLLFLSFSVVATQHNDRSQRSQVSYMNKYMK